MPQKNFDKSPKWTNSTKIIVNVLILVVIIGLLIRFSSLITPLVIALLFSLLFHPIAEILNKRLHLAWNLAVNIIFLVVLSIFISLITIGGIALIDQISGLINFLQNILPNLPGFLVEISSRSFLIGPFVVDLTKINWTEIGNQLINLVQPILSQLGNIIGSIAGGTINILGTFFLAFVLSYLIVAETGGARERILIIDIPGYRDDLERMGKEITLIWNSFLRGQAVVFFFRTILYMILLGSLGVRFFVGLAIGAGLANFIPYIGVAVAWVTYFFVALFQGTTLFGLDSFSYALLVMGSAWLLDNLYDNTITPRIMGGALKLHPAAIMVAALIGLNLFGVMGMILAAPVLATLKLGFQYVQRKMKDQDPWEGMQREYSNEKDLPLFGRLIHKIAEFFERTKNKHRISNSPENQKNEKT